MSRLSIRDADGATTDVDTDYIRLIDVRGAGAPPLLPQAVTTPGRDGETYIRTVLAPRFLVVEWDLAGDNFTATQGLRRDLLRLVNPKRGLLTLLYTPLSTTYEISAVFADGLGFDNRGEEMREFREYPVVSFRCSDPAWRVSPVNVSPLIVPDSGLTVPLEIPLSVSESTITDTIDNDGDLDSYPVITADGPFEGLTVRNTTTGLSVSFLGLVVAAGETLTIDMDRRTADVDGTNVMPYRSADSQAWPLVPGNNSITATTVSGGTTVTLTWWTRLIGV